VADDATPRRRLTFELLRPPDRRSRFEVDLLSADEQILVLSHLVHPKHSLMYRGEEVIADGYRAIWFLFKDQPYDIGRFYRPDGSWTGYYVDVLEPVRWQGADAEMLETLVDLFLDVWIAPEGSYEVLDEDEFEEALRLGHITDAQAEHARRVLHDIADRVQRGNFLPDVVTRYSMGTDQHTVFRG